MDIKHDGCKPEVFINFRQYCIRQWLPTLITIVIVANLSSPLYHALITSHDYIKNMLIHLILHGRPLAASSRNSEIMSVFVGFIMLTLIIPLWYLTFNILIPLIICICRTKSLDFTCRNFLIDISILYLRNESDEEIMLGDRFLRWLRKQSHEKYEDQYMMIYQAELNQSLSSLYCTKRRHSKKEKYCWIKQMYYLRQSEQIYKRLAEKGNKIGLYHYLDILSDNIGYGVSYKFCRQMLIYPLKFLENTSLCQAIYSNMEPHDVQKLFTQENEVILQRKNGHYKDHYIIHYRNQKDFYYWEEDECMEDIVEKRLPLLFEKLDINENQITSILNRDLKIELLNIAIAIGGCNVRIVQKIRERHMNCVNSSSNIR
ncbi:MAG: hypothetical protein GY821_07280 [Gammaproteobacteria bacterium]|nr:hypothetical protein [Gammaproteobacteria bacterium]